MGYARIAGIRGGGSALDDYGPEEMLQRFTSIVLSREFRVLRRRLEAFYKDSGAEDAREQAFVEALYTFWGPDRPRAELH